MGLALARIRDGELFKTEYDSFEAYFRVKWQDGRHDVNCLISAAQVFTDLVTIGHQTKPEHERQVRPLVGLTPDQAQVAWERAIEKAGSVCEAELELGLSSGAMNKGRHQPLPFESQGQEGGPADSVLTRTILDSAGPTRGRDEEHTQERGREDLIVLWIDLLPDSRQGLLLRITLPFIIPGRIPIVSSGSGNSFMMIE